MSIPLNTSSTAAFVSDGLGGTVARIRLGPQRYGESWHVTSVSVSTTSVAATTCRLYRNAESPSTFLDGTSAGNQNVSTIPRELGTLETLLFVFTGGTMGTVATALLSGTTSNTRDGI